MSIKCVACDFDGTFVNSDGNYDEKRFTAILDQLTQKNVQFVCASGDQYYLLHTRFGANGDRISYVADNGAYVIDKGETVFTADVNREAIFKALHYINDLEGVSVLVCCKNSGYGLKTMTEKEYKWLKKFYERITLLDSYDEIDDTFFKVNMEFAKEKSDEFYHYLEPKLNDVLDVVTASIGSININGKGNTKASGLKKIMDRYNIKPDEVMAFGDGHNDIEMLSMVKYGYAMSNAQPDMLERFKLHAPSNNRQGVLCVLEEALKDKRFD